MIPILADATPSWTSTLMVLSFFANLGMCLATIGLWRAAGKRQQTEVSPQPLIVAMQKEFATRHELEKVQDSFALTHKEVVAVINAVERGANERIATELNSLRSERSRDVGQLHEKINSVGRIVAGLEKETDLQNQKMASMDAKLDRLIERS